MPLPETSASILKRICLPQIVKSQSTTILIVSSTIGSFKRLIILTQLNRHIALSIPTLSADCGRVFSNAKLLTDRGACMADDLMEANKYLKL